jgi:hypothetical protein
MKWKDHHNYCVKSGGFQLLLECLNGTSMPLQESASGALSFISDSPKLHYAFFIPENMTHLINASLSSPSVIVQLNIAHIFNSKNNFFFYFIIFLLFILLIYYFFFLNFYKGISSRQG